jgi:hypothetical protein
LTNRRWKPVCPEIPTKWTLIGSAWKPRSELSSPSQLFINLWNISMIFWCLEPLSFRAPFFASLFLPRSCFTYFRNQHWFADRPTHFPRHFRSNAHSHFAIAAIFCRCWSRKYVKHEHGRKREGKRGARSFVGHWGIRKSLKYFISWCIIENVMIGKVDFELVPIKIRFVGSSRYF